MAARSSLAGRQLRLALEQVVGQRERRARFPGGCRFPRRGGPAGLIDLSASWMALSAASVGSVDFWGMFAISDVASSFTPKSPPPALNAAAARAR